MSSRLNGTLVVENKFFCYRFFMGVCKCLTDSALQRYFGNQLLHFD